jgi:hypothetical protein
MITKHTPGPWAVVGGDWSYDGNVRYELEGIDVIRRADADLIEAAPDLLAVLIELVDMEGPLPGTQAWHAKALAAIAKATGEQS